jgi:hypothetical protein
VFLAIYCNGKVIRLRKLLFHNSKLTLRAESSHGDAQVAVAITRSRAHEAVSSLGGCLNFRSNVKGFVWGICCKDAVGEWRYVSKHSLRMLGYIPPCTEDSGQFTSRSLCPPGKGYRYSLFSRLGCRCHEQNPDSLVMPYTDRAIPPGCCCIMRMPIKFI